jgi:signal transduction histidine kinase
VVRISAEQDAVSFEVRDDGVGFDPIATPHGSGLTNMTDRMAALGGTLDIRSRPGAGTTVAGRIPGRTHSGLSG